MSIYDAVVTGDSQEYMSVRAIRVLARLVSKATNGGTIYDQDIAQLSTITEADILNEKGCGEKTGNEIWSRLVSARQRVSNLKLEIIDAMSQFC